MTAADLFARETVNLRKATGCTHLEAFLKKKAACPELYAAMERGEEVTDALLENSIGGGGSNFITSHDQVNARVRGLLPPWALSELQIKEDTNNAQAIYLLSKCGETFDAQQGLRLAREMVANLMRSEQIDEPTAVARLKELAPAVGKFLGRKTTLDGTMENAGGSAGRSVRLANILEPGELPND